MIKVVRLRFRSWGIDYYFNKILVDYRSIECDGDKFVDLFFDGWVEFYEFEEIFVVIIFFDYV